MLKYLLWIKYLCKRRIVLLSITAVALSVSLLIVVANLFTSFIDAYEQLAVDMLGDVILFTAVGFSQYDSLIQQLEQTDAVEAATTTINAPGLLHLGRGNVRRVDITGIEPAGFARVTKLKSSLLRRGDLSTWPSFDHAIKGRLGAFVGIAVLQEPNEITDTYDFHAAQQRIGEKILLTCGAMRAPDERAQVASQTIPKRRTIRATITDVVFTGAYPLDKESIYLPLEAFYHTLHPDRNEVLVDRVQIKINPSVPMDVARATILGAWQAFADQWGYSRYAQVYTAQKLQETLMREIKKQLGVLLLIFGLIDIGAVILVFCIFYMIVQLKRKDIAIIKSCGASRMTIMGIFLGFGLLVGGIGSLAGGALGCLITKNINTLEHWVALTFGITLWDSNVYMFNQIPSHVDRLSLLNITLLATIAAALGSLVPAFVAGATKPLEILRYE